MGGATPNNLNTLQGLPAVGGESIFITRDTTAGTQGRFYSFDTVHKQPSADTAVQRAFPLYGQLHLRFRAEAFNLLNHPNFGLVNAACGTGTAGATCNSTIMGQATNTLSNALTGAASIYQEGGPRSLQFALRLEF